MRKAFLTLLAVLLLSTPVMAAGKIGVVNMPRVIKESEAGNSARESLANTFKPLQEDVDRQKAELDKMRTELQNQSLVLSQSAKIDKEEEFKRRIRDLQDTMQSMQRKYKVEEKKLTEPIILMIMEVMKDFGTKQGYDLIVDRMGSGVLFASDATDVTNEIIVEVNKAWRAKKK